MSIPILKLTSTPTLINAYANTNANANSNVYKITIQ